MKVELVKGVFLERQENGKTRIWQEGDVCLDAELELGALDAAEKQAHAETPKKKGKE